MTDLRTGIGYDVHPFCPGTGFFLGGVWIPHPGGLQGYSDGDVLLHAICDALLGACALGDLGTHFPDSDPSYKGISSLTLLARVGQLVKEADFLVVNLDATVVAERPRLAPYIPEMTKKIASTLLLDDNQVSVKATTSEGLGFVGRAEGIACLALAAVRCQG